MFKSKLGKRFLCILLTVLMLSVTVMGSVNAGMTNGTKFLGNVIAGSAPTNYGTYWNQVTPENGGKWGSVEGTRGTMSWATCDVSYNYARAHGMQFKFHCLVWGSQQPSWISGLSAADQKTEVTEWIAAAGAKYKDAEYVDVVNEALHTTPPYSNAIGGTGTTGWDWIVWSFQQARIAFPNSKLLINEYGIISDPNAAANYVAIINILKGKGLIDGIGIQCHQFNMDTVSVSTMNSVLNTLTATGLPIYVSELDMDSADDATQLALYQQKFPVLWENSNVKGITLWGYEQGKTWKDNTWLVRSDGSERPALQWLKTYLANGSTPTPTPVATATPTPAATATATATPAATATATATATPTPAATATATPVATATPTPTPGGPTVTPAPTATPTPVVTPGPGGLKVQFFNSTTSATVNTLSTNFKIVNTGTTAINLSDVKVRYYFTNDGTQLDSFACDYSTAGNGNITGTFTTIAKTNADRYLEVGFTTAAGTLAAGAGTEVKTRIWKSDWSNFTQTNDYSFNATATNYVDWSTVTGFIAGALKWGTEP